MTKKKNIYQIADELNLAPSTISKVLNNSGRISQETRNRVLDYVKTINFVPTTSAKNLKSKNTSTIGVITLSNSYTDLEIIFHSKVFWSFMAHMYDVGYEVIFITKKIGRYEMSYYDWCLNKKVEGVYIIGSTFDEKEIIELINGNIPSVLSEFGIKDGGTDQNESELGKKAALTLLSLMDSKKHNSISR